MHINRTIVIHCLVSKPFQKNLRPGQLQTVEESVSKMLAVINNCTDTGSFLSYDGTRIPW